MLQLIFYFSLLPVPVLGAIAVLMYLRKQHRIYPAFWAYVCFQLGREALSLVLQPARTSYSYFYFYWITAFCSVVFTLVLLRSIFVAVLANYTSLARIRRVGFEVALAAAWITAVAISFSSEHSKYWIPRTILHAESAVSLTAVCMFLFVVGASAVLGLKWTSAVCGIAAGLGLLGTVDLLIYTVWQKAARMGPHAVLLGLVDTLAYDIAVGIFALYFLPRRVEVQVPERLEPEVVQWMDSMKGAISK